VVLALGVGAVFLGGKITGATNNPLPVVIGLIFGLFSLFLAPYYGRKAARKGGYSAMIAAQTAVIDFDPNNADAYYWRGQLYMTLAGEYAWPHAIRRICRKAIADFDEAVRLAPDFSAAYVSRVNALGAMGQLQQAVTDYTAAIQLDPNNAFAYCARATAYNGLYRYDRSIPDADAAIRLAPDLYLGYDARGYGFWHRGNATGTRADYEQAVSDFTEALRLNPAAVDCYMGRAQVYWALGEAVNAAADEATVAAASAR
jgi:tetratricopeptide (TPR) repeat protein